MQNSTTRLAIGAMIALEWQLLASARLLRPNKGFSSTGTNPSCRRPMRRGSMIVSSSEDTYLRIGAVMRPISDHDRSVGVVCPVPAVGQGISSATDRRAGRAGRSREVAGCSECEGVAFPPSPPQEGHPRDTGKSSEEWPPVRKHATGRGHLRPPPPSRAGSRPRSRRP